MTATTTFDFTPLPFRTFVATAPSLPLSVLDVPMPEPAASLPRLGRRIVIISAPSGAGKTTILKAMLTQVPQLAFSVSATTRLARPHEVHGRDYYFLSEHDFRELLAQNAFVETEEVYPGRYYGTLYSEIERIVDLGKAPVFEVDVKGGMHLKTIFQAEALAIFIEPPSVKTLEERLTSRATEKPEEIARRVAKATAELAFADQFDAVVVNQDLATAVSSVTHIVRHFLTTGARPTPAPPATRYPAHAQQG